MARAAALGCITLLALTGCGGGDSDKDRVTDYLKEANAVTERHNARFAAANETFKKFADGDLKGRKAGKELRRAELDIATVQSELAALHPPARARHLHELLLRAYELNVLMAAETRQMAGYVPRAQEALRRLSPIQKRLRKGLQASGASSQVAALRRYAASLKGVTDRLAELEVPPTLASDRETQLRVLGRARSLGLQLARAIEREDAPTVRRLLRRFTSGGDPQPELAGLATGSIEAYRQRLVTIDRAAADARAERARLARDLL